jgi:GT2 family glycosyltransferase
VAALKEGPARAGTQGLLLRLGAGGERTQVVDSTGLEMRRDRRVIARRQGEFASARDRVPGPVWGVDGPLPVYRTAALMQVRVRRDDGHWEVFDEDFFMYKEDVDLAWRLRRLGWSAWYEPRAVAWHARGAGAGRPSSVVDVIRSDRLIPQWIKSTSWRNHRLMQLKNETVGDYLRDLPWIARREVLSLGFMTLVDPRRLVIVAELARLARSAVRKRSATRTRS